MVRDLGQVMKRDGLAFGLFIMKSLPTKGMREEAASHPLVETQWGRFPALQIVTLAELFQGKRPQLPPLISPVTRPAGSRHARAIRRARRGRCCNPDLSPCEIGGRRISAGRRGRRSWRGVWPLLARRTPFPTLSRRGRGRLPQMIPTAFPAASNMPRIVSTSSAVCSAHSEQRSSVMLAGVAGGRARLT